jgi:hypothetical protein
MPSKSNRQLHERAWFAVPVTLLGLLFTAWGAFYATPIEHRGPFIKAGKWLIVHLPQESIAIATTIVAVLFAKWYCRRLPFRPYGQVPNHSAVRKIDKHLPSQFILDDKTPAQEDHQRPTFTKPVLKTLTHHFGRLNVERNNAFVNAGYFDADPDRKCIGAIISVTSFRGVEGIAPSAIVLKQRLVAPSFPEYAQQTSSSVSLSGKDGNKVALTGWAQSPLDVDEGKVSLDVSLCKYSLKLAMREESARLINDLVNRKWSISNGDTPADPISQPFLPCLLHCDAVVLTSDNHVILAQRSGRVDIDEGQWAASFGESMDWDTDRGNTYGLHPVNTLWRGMKEELGLSQKWIEAHTTGAAEITFTELGFQIDSFIYILFSIVKLPNIASDVALERARYFRTDNSEARIFSSVEFSERNCAEAVAFGHLGGKRLNYSGRFGLLLAALNQFGTKFIRALE